MDIGGIDKSLNIPYSTELEHFVNKWFGSFWPNVILVKEDRELFFYENLRMMDSVNEHGATEDNKQSLVYVIFENERLTCVVGDECQAALTDELFASINANRSFFE